MGQASNKMIENKNYEKDILSCFSTTFWYKCFKELYGCDKIHVRLGNEWFSYHLKKPVYSEEDYLTKYMKELKVGDWMIIGMKGKDNKIWHYAKTRFDYDEISKMFLTQLKIFDNHYRRMYEKRQEQKTKFIEEIEETAKTMEQELTLVEERTNK